MLEYKMPQIVIDFSPWQEAVDEMFRRISILSDKLKNEEAKRSLFNTYEDATHIFDIEVFEDYGDHTWAQARYLVHGFDDVYWTNSAKQAARFMKESLKAAKKDNASVASRTS